MGGNGSRSAFLADTLDGYSGVRFEEIDKIDGVKVIQAVNQTQTAQPMEAFTSRMYYVADHKTGEIKHIDFYDKNGDIKHSIDLKFNDDGSFKPYREVFRKGKIRPDGSHFHREWPKQENGNKGRTSHDNDNIEAINKYYMRFVNKAIKFNQHVRNHTTKKS